MFFSQMHGNNAMTKLLFRFFIICIFFTVLLFLFMMYLYNIIDRKDTLDNFKLLTQGTFYSLDHLLEQYPEQEWQTILNKKYPAQAGKINIIPINQLSLNKKQVEKIKNNETVYTVSDVDNQPTAIYKKINHSNYAYQYFLDFSDTEKIHRYFGWAPILISERLKKMPEQQWPDFLSNLSQQFGYSVSIQNIHSVNNPIAKQILLKNEWAADFPNKTDDSIQILYIPFSKDKILMFGPIHLPFVGVYQKYILFAFAFIMIEFLIFILAILFSRSLEKLKKLAHDYGRGNFESHIQLSKTSTLYSLFSDLQWMGKRIQNLIIANKDLTDAVSHELRTPVSRLRFRLELLKNSKDSEGQSKRIMTMEEDITELENLISEVLAYSQLDRVNQIELTKINLNQLIHAAIDQFKKTTSTKKLITAISNDAIDVFANEKLILRVLQNLLQNANHFANTIIKISTAKIGSQYHMMVEDDGLGIPEENREMVFEPFKQLSNQPEDAKKGYGLGLAITKKILDQHQWQILITDSELGGAKIIIILSNQENS